MLLYKIADELDEGVVFTDEPDNAKMTDAYCLGCDAKGNLYIVLKLLNKYVLSGWTPNYVKFSHADRENVDWFVLPVFEFPKIERVEDAIKVVGSEEKLLDHINHTILNDMVKE